jgi:hypothetical protein
MPKDPNEGAYAPYGKDKINIAGNRATVKPYPYTRTNATNPKNGNRTTTVKNNTTGKSFTQDTVDRSGRNFDNRFVADSTAHMNAGKKQAEKFNLGMAASKEDGGKLKGKTFYPKPVLKAKGGAEKKAFGGAINKGASSKAAAAIEAKKKAGRSGSSSDCGC